MVFVQVIAVVFANEHVLALLAPNDFHVFESPDRLLQHPLVGVHVVDRLGLTGNLMPLSMLLAQEQSLSQVGGLLGRYRRRAGAGSVGCRGGSGRTGIEVAAVAVFTVVDNFIARLNGKKRS